MAPDEKLARPGICLRCEGAIPVGTPLGELSWDRQKRAWAHRNPTCTEVWERGSPSRPIPSPPTEASVETATSTESAAVRAASGTLWDMPAGGSWSVTVEFHEAEDPAQSKRVLRIARLRLNSLEEAVETAERLRRKVKP